ncbi:GPW/gp25 family protein [Teredinibacter haidensis]|uniref:GPW/gp25 family protein n=1 Tax=Teredinibacter haidensis TaxID=2731755 RepID=UPI000A9AFCBD|nr:GPW/gp25 family protein [Teredinibacter haidensis]
MRKINSDEFLGTGWSFPPTFNRLDAGIELVNHEEDIKQSLLILFSTSPGERLMYPEFGCTLKKMVFETLNLGAISKIRDAVKRAILFFEPRIELERVDVNTDNDPKNKNCVYNGYLEIEVHYRIRQTNTRSNMVYPFYFSEADNV